MRRRERPRPRVPTEDRERPRVRSDDSSSRRSVYLWAKRAFDISLSLLGLMLASPLLLLTAVWVRLDSRGPVLYRQRRVGRDGVEFEMLKFRTMHAQAESQTGPVWAAEGDERVTRAGRVLRRLYLDELPQLFNIVRGDMSFVGPRPERAFFYPRCEAIVPGFSARSQVRPGLTGLAQISQSHSDSPAAVRRKFRYDMFYIRHRSFLLDNLIILRTFVLLWREFRQIWR